MLMIGNWELGWGRRLSVRMNRVRKWVTGMRNNDKNELHGRQELNRQIPGE